MINTLAIANYRSLRNVVAPLGPLNLVSGENGSGKSSLYRGLRLLADTAQGGVVASLAREGGLSSTLWAGPEKISRAMRTGEHPVQGGPRREPVHLRLGFATDELSYCIDLGLPEPMQSAFSLDPEIKRECIWAGMRFRPASLLVDRRGAVVSVRREDGEWSVVSSHVPTFDSMLTRIADPQRAPEVLTLRETIRAWRFYDHFRVDADAPMRSAQVGTRTPVMANDGRDLAPALQTIREIGDGEALERTIQDAFPGSVLEIEYDRGRFSLGLKQAGMLRALTAAELSDGHAAFSVVVRRAAHAAPATADGPQRARNQSPSRSASRARAPHSRCVQALAALGRFPFVSPDRGAGAGPAMQLAAPDQGHGSNADRGTGVDRRALLAMAGALTGLPTIRSRAS